VHKLKQVVKNMNALYIAIYWPTFLQEKDYFNISIC